MAWQAGLTTFARFPLLGVGTIAFGHTYDALRPPDAPGPHTPVAFDPHSLPIAFAADGGILGLVFFGATLVIILPCVVRAARSASLVPRALAFGLVSGFVALLVDCGINTVVVFFPLYFQVVPIALGVSRTDAL